MNCGRKFGSGGAVNDACEIFLIGTVAGGGGERQGTSEGSETKAHAS